MSWKKTEQSVRERMAANRRRYNEASLRDALEEQAIRALAERKTLPVFCKENFRPVDRNSKTRWLLLPEHVSAVRGAGLVPDVGGPVYCRACGYGIGLEESRVSFQFTWGSPAVSTAFMHAHDCQQQGVTEI